MLLGTRSLSQTVLLMLAAGGIACSGDGDPADSPPAIPSIPPLAVHGRFEDIGAYNVTSKAIHAGQFADGVDVGRYDDLHESDWRASLALTPPEQADPSFAARLDDPLNDASHFNALIAADIVDGITADLSDKVGVTIDVDPPMTTFRGYPVEAARWEEYQYLPIPGALQKFEYADPSALDAVRTRAARLYCAMREAERRDGTASIPLEERWAASFSVLGHEFRFLDFIPTIRIDPPKKYIISPTSRWFYTPMDFGAIIAPIKGLTGTWGEMRYPVDLITGESEVHTQTAPNVFVGTDGRFHIDFLAKYATETHADVIKTQSVSVTPGFQILLYSFGVGKFGETGEINLKIGFPIHVGDPDDIDPKLAPADPAGREKDEYLLGVYNGTYYYNGTAANWPKARDGEPLVPGFADGYWQLSAGSHPDLPFIQQHVLWNWQVGTSDTDLTAGTPLFPFDPMVARGFQADDRKIAGQMQFGLRIGVEGEFGPQFFGVFKALLVPYGALEVDETLKHTLLIAPDAEVSTQNVSAMTPVDLLTVSPSGEFDMTGEAGVDIELELHVGFLNFTKTIHIVHFGKDIASTPNDPWPESDNLRVGFGSDQGTDTRLQPTVFSHVPNGEAFVSLPEDVPTCLADPTPPPDPAPSGKYTPESTNPPIANFCLQWKEATPLITVDPCGDIAGYSTSASGGDGAKAACITDSLNLVCSPLTKTIIDAASDVKVIHKMVAGHTGDFDTWSGIVVECGAAYSDPSLPDSDRSDEANAYLNATFDLYQCDDGLTPITGTTGDIPVTPGPGGVTSNPCTGTTCATATKGGCGWCLTSSMAEPGDATRPAPGYPSCDVGAWIWRSSDCP